MDLQSVEGSREGWLEFLGIYGFDRFEIWPLATRGTFGIVSENLVATFVKIEDDWGATILKEISVGTSRFCTRFAADDLVAVY